MERIHLEVYGRVQGVAFRAYAMRKARSLGLHGWVRNRSDGSVEVVAEGEAGALDELAAWCRSGPPLSIVARVDAERLDYVGDLQAFGIRYG